MSAKNKVQVDALKDEVEELRSRVEVAEREKAETLARIDNERHEVEMRLNSDHKIALHEVQNELDEVSAQVQLMKSKKDFLVSEKSWVTAIGFVFEPLTHHLGKRNENGKLRSQITEEINATKAETQRCNELVAEVDVLACELSKKDAAITQLRSELQSAEDDNRSSKKDLHAAMAQSAEIASGIKPLEDAIEAHETEKATASKNLRACQSQTDFLRRQIADKVQTLKNRDAKIRSLHSVIRNRERHIKSIEGEVEILAGLSDDKALRREAVAMYQKHIKDESKNPNN